ncbi:MAG: DUF4190 domain-containing protein [Thermoguttaceae bacterium]
MPDTMDVLPRLSGVPECDANEYRSVSASAVLGLFFGLVGAAALLSPLLWFLPIAGAVFSVIGLRRIAAAGPALIGRKLAVAGLVLSLLFATAGPADWILYRRMIEREGCRFAGYWFDYLREREPHKAYELTVAPDSRIPLDDKTRESFTAGSKDREDLETYVKNPLVRTLLTLGDRARSRYYGTEKDGVEPDSEYLEQIFAVTYDADREPVSFFVRVRLQRVVPPNSRRAYWRVVNVTGGVHPAT